jgi:hypothetical protein
VQIATGYLHPARQARRGPVHGYWPRDAVPAARAGDQPRRSELPTLARHRRSRSAPSWGAAPPAVTPSLRPPQAHRYARGRDLGPQWLVARFLYEFDDYTRQRRLHTHNVLVLVSPAEMTAAAVFLGRACG